MGAMRAFSNQEVGMKEMRHAPANLNEAAAHLRTILDVPEDAVQVVANERLDYVVQIALAWTLSDVGDAENGPRLHVDVTRWVDVDPPSSDSPRWSLHVYDLDGVDVEDYGDFMEAYLTPKSTMLFAGDMGPDVSGEVVANAVGDLFKALGVTPGKEAS